ncbi:hypothetical protein [Methanosarcina sp.]
MNENGNINRVYGILQKKDKRARKREMKTIYLGQLEVNKELSGLEGI